MLSTSSTQMVTILCIDDDPRVLQTESALLEAKGYTVLSAPNGATAIEITRKHSVDAIVLDLKMSGMGGNDVAEVIMKEQPSVPVAIFSGSVDEVPEDLKWYADALVNKGDGPEELLSAVTKLVQIATAKKYLFLNARRRPHHGAV